MPAEPNPEGAAEYRELIASHGMSQVGAGKLFGVDERTARRWAETGPPDSVLMVLVLMKHHGHTPEDLCRIVGFPVPKNLRPTPHTDRRKPRP